MKTFKVSLLVMLIAPPFALCQTGNTKVAFIKGNDLFVQVGTGEVRQLTTDNVPKGLPLWSKDGAMIAFARKDIDSKTDDLARIVTIRANDGKQLADISFRPAAERHPESMRFVERLQWLTSNRIVVSGSIDPTTSEYVTVSVPDGKEIDDYYDQGMGAAYSSDGVHIAYVAGSPHFAPEDHREPNLQIDGRRIYPKKGVHVTFLSAPAWAPSDAYVAIIEEDYTTHNRSLVECSRLAKCSETAIPNQSQSSSYDVVWDDSGVNLFGGGQTWIQAALGAPLVASRPSKLIAAKALEKELKAKIRNSGGKEADVWCENCSLTKFPRRTSGLPGNLYQGDC